MNELSKNMSTDDIRNAIEKDDSFIVPVQGKSEGSRRVDLNSSIQKTSPQVKKVETPKEDDIEDESKKATEVTILSARIKMEESNISTEDDMIIHGRYENGILSCNVLTISPGAYVSGQINAKQIKNQGYLEGQINTQHFYAYENSTTTGSVEAITIGIQVNANVSANLKTRSMVNDINNSDDSEGSISISGDD